MLANTALASPPDHHSPAQPDTETASESTTLLRLIELARDLTSVLDREIHLLRKLEVNSIKELSDQKAQLTEEYRGHVRALRENPGFSETLEPRLRDELADVIERLNETAQANETALKAAMDAHDRVFRAIASAVEAQQREASGYAATGAHSGGTSGGAPVSLRINESL